MLKKSLFLILFLLLFSFTSKAYAVSPTTTYALSGSLTATTSSGIQFFTLSGSTDEITGSNEASGSITYSSGAFSGSITIANTGGSITLSGSGDTISYNGSSITYDSSTDTFSGSISLSLSENLTTPATCSDGSTPTSGSCPSGTYLTCPSGYTLSGDTCSETVSGSFTLSGSGSNIDISGGSSTGSISMTQTEVCPTGYTLSSGSCVSNTDAGTTSTYVCTDGTNYQNCDAGGSILPSGSAYLCPLGQTQCNENTSTPSFYCSSGGSITGGAQSQIVAPADDYYGYNVNFPDTNADWIYDTVYNAALQPSGAMVSLSKTFNVSSNTSATIYTNFDDIGWVYLNGQYIGYDGNYWHNTASFPVSLQAGNNTLTLVIENLDPPNPNPSTVVASVIASDGTVLVDTNGSGWITAYCPNNDTSNNALFCASLTFSGEYCYVNSSSCPNGYISNSSQCVNTVSLSCPTGTTLVNNECVSYSCPLNGTPQGSAPGQNYTCVEPSGSSNYYCSPNICYNNTTNTPVSTTETMPAPQTNNGTVTSSGCQGSIYIFPGQALQCTRDFVLGENCCSRSKFLLGGRSCSSNSQIIAKAIIYDNQYSPPVPIYSGSGDMNTAPITSCSQSEAATGCGQQGEAIYLGDYCSLKLPIVGTCLADTYVFCKFQGLLATIIQAQGRAQLAGGPNAVSWGSVQSPNCTGFTPTQFQELNFANMNLSEYIAVIKNQVSNTLTTSAIDNQIQQTTQSIGNEINQLETGGALTGTTP